VAPFRGSLQRQPDRLGNFIIANLARAAGTRLVVKSIHAAICKSPPPFADGVLNRSDAASNHLVLQSLGRQQYNARPLRQALCRTPTPRQPVCTENLSELLT
jgi:hypothetical protein